MVPRVARYVLVEVVISSCEDVEPSPQLIGNDDGVRVGKLLAIPRVHHGGVEGATPQVHVIPMWPRPRTGYCGRENQVFGCSKCHDCILSNHWFLSLTMRRLTEISSPFPGTPSRPGDRSEERR